MDKTTQRLARYATSLKYAQLTPGAIRSAEKLLIDSVGCALGGYHGEPCAISRTLASRIRATPAARVWGSGAATSTEMAAFSNSVMLRYLDFNDMYTSIGEGHPSDMIPAVIAVAEAHHASGADTVLALVVAYEVYMAIADCVSLADRGWDHGYFVVFGAAAGAGRILGLSDAQMENALSIASSANVPTRQTRRGELSMWKGCATAASARAGVFAAELAAEGMTGPAEAFEGRHGVWDQVTGPFTVQALGGEAGTPFGVERCALKFFPTEYHTQVTLSLMTRLYGKFALDALESIHVETYYRAYAEIGDEPERWDPQTRETADHSLPYMLAVALQDGAVTVESFTDERVADPTLRPIMKRITVSENKGFTRRFPKELVSRIEIRTRDGTRYVEEGCYPKGHDKDPMTEAEVEQKFRSLCRAVIPDAQAQSILDAIWGMASARDVGAIVDLLHIA